MIKNLFNKLFGKEEEIPHYDLIDIKITDLEQGYLLDYDFETWTVKSMAEYDWGRQYFSREFKIVSLNKTRYLHIEEEDEDLSIQLYEKIKMKDLGNIVTNYIKSNQTPPDMFVYKGVEFTFQKEDAGYYREIPSNETEEVVSFSYEDSSGAQLCCIEQWDANDFEAYIGKSLKSFEIDNILPKPN